MAKVEKIPYFDLTGQFDDLKSEWFDEIGQLGKTGNFILGPAIERFESSIAEYLGVEHAVSVSSGTDALILALQALGIGPGDSVVIPDFTFFATAEAVSLTGAAPVFADIEPATFNIDADRLETVIRPDTKAIVPVHLFGAPAKMTQINQIAKRKGIAVVEDAAQAFGAKIGKMHVGAWGDVGCFSFYPTKVLGAFGDGGLITTGDGEIANKLRLMRNHGVAGANIHCLIGRTSRLNCVQAALLQIKLQSVDDKIHRRQQLAKLYIDHLQGLELSLPQQPEGMTHVYNILTISTPMRDVIARALSEEQIGHQIYYPMPVHRQQPYRSLEIDDADYPEAVRASTQVISLPLYPEMPTHHVERICDVIRNAIA